MNLKFPPAILHIYKRVCQYFRCGRNCWACLICLLHSPWKREVSVPETQKYQFEWKQHWTELICYAKCIWCVERRDGWARKGGLWRIFRPFFKSQSCLAQSLSLALMSFYFIHSYTGNTFMLHVSFPHSLQLVLFLPHPSPLPPLTFLFFRHALSLHAPPRIQSSLLISASTCFPFFSLWSPAQLLSEVGLSVKSLPQNRMTAIFQRSRFQWPWQAQSHCGTGFYTPNHFIPSPKG